MPWRAAPLKSSFMLAGIVGFLISVIYIPKYSLNWAFAFGLVFLIMVVATLVSMTQSRPVLPTYKKKKK
ncbi:hypothetical protein KY338_02980 [Candidatus Woesearchaeota archaeon]|nr:hypothetical protein [Candidatus Woesearchaeota archaeon]MBW3005681.1 hypothetical protein [Candidatus Woesearchaeota archaeon]